MSGKDPENTLLDYNFLLGMVGNDFVVKLAGTLVRPKDSCESQRMHDQIWYTVSQFSPTRAVIYLNNALLGDLLVVTNK